jgi:serine/threonine-protein kinase
MNDTTGFEPNVTTDPSAGTVDHNSTVDHPNQARGDAGTVDHVPVDAAAAENSAARPKKGRELPTVPGYEILAVLGRGAMGVVYKAHQTRLNRIVALKMVLAGAHASPQQLARFDQEARAVARLQHPNIVQIHEIGERDGLPYFSLEFVDGGTLSQLIDRHPQPPRTAAELTETLARAMQFAHEQNVIHRDLKPDNVLLTRSAPRSSGSVSMEPGSRSLFSGSAKSVELGAAATALTPKISDFGLAKAIEEGSQNTASGTIMGTPSYMAPEQARGDTSALGPLCDLYSLGAILYDLLTGRPPFQGATILDTLDQVRNREPVPVRQLQPKVPIDLETICLKCLQKDPGKRYANCAELADDLARFLAGHPIQARPVSGAERFWRWCRRNPRVAGLTAAAALLLVCTAAVSLWAALTMSAKNKVIEDEKTAAVHSAKEAEEARQVAVAAEKVAAENSRLAGEQAAIALTTLQRLISKVQDEAGLDAAPETLEFKRYMMQTALDGVLQVSKRGEGSTSLEATQAAAHMQLGQMFKQLGKSREAMAEFKKVHEIARARVVIKQGTDASRRNLAAALLMLAEMDKELNRDMQACLAHNKESLALWEDIDQNPKADELGQGLTKKSDVKSGMAELNTRVGVTYVRLGDPLQGMPYFRKALAIRRELSLSEPNNLAYRLDLARSLLAIGDTSFRVEDRPMAIASFDECMNIIEDVFRQRPAILMVKQELARASSLKGDFHLRSGETEKARPLYERALTLTKEIVKAEPKKVDYQWDLGHAHYRLGLVALRARDEGGGREHFENSRAVREKLATQDKGNDRRQMELMLPLAHCGKHVEAAGIAATLLGGVTDGELLVDAARCYAQCAAASSDEATRQQYTTEAIQTIGKAVKQGYRDVVYLSTEVDLDPLRPNEGFARIIEEIRRDKKSP